MQRDTLFAHMMTAYGRWYDLDQTQEMPIAAFGAFHEEGMGYAVSKKVKLYSANRHEYAYFYNVPQLTKEIYDTCLAKTLEKGMPLVDPVPGHMSTYITMIILCDRADPEALAALKKCRIRKSFQFSLRGWMEVHTAAVMADTETVTANAAAYHTAKFLKSILRPKRKWSLLSTKKREKEGKK